MLADACGNPCEFLITDGTTHDVKVAPELLNKGSLNITEYMSADKDCDADSLREIITEHQLKPSFQRSETQDQIMIIWIDIFTKSDI